MKEIFLMMKQLFEGRWAGEGFAKFPTIDNTAYTEQLEFIADQDKDSIFFCQKSWYKDNTEKNGHTVFWDTGFIILKDNEVLLQSVQVGGRIEIYKLEEPVNEAFTFNSISIINDPKATKSQRTFTVDRERFHYKLNMATHAAEFQNHLSAHLKRSNFSHINIIK